MNLEELNKEYLTIQDEIKKLNEQLEGFQKNLDKLERERAKHVGEMYQAEDDGYLSIAKQEKLEVDRIDKEIKDISEDARKTKVELITCKNKVNEKIEEIKQNPEMKKHLDEVLDKQYSRKIAGLEKKREEANQRKTRLSNLNNLIARSPSLANNLKGILSAKKQIEDLNAELEGITNENGTYKNPVRANEIKNKLLPAAENKMNMNKAPLLAYIEKKGLDIKEEDIDSLSTIIDGKGNVDLTTTMSHNMAKINREIKGYEKNIKNHIVAREGLSTHQQVKKDNPEPIVEDKARDEEDSIDEDKKAESDEPKWYQFGKRFRNWREKRKQKALSEGTDETTKTTDESKEEETTPEPVSKTEQKNIFRNSLKYAIVKDALEENKQEGMKEAKKEAKVQSSEDKEPEK